MEKISEHISWREAVESWTARRFGIDNTPPRSVLENMRAVAEEVFEPLRRHFGVPIKINSFYRSLLLNRLIGGSPTSQHVRGEAIDIDDDYSKKFGITNKDFFCWIAKNLIFDQLIWEYGTDENPDWVHFSYKRNGKNRGMILRAVRTKYGTRYKRIKLDDVC